MNQICIVEGNDGYVFSNFLKKNGIGIPVGFTNEDISKFYACGSVSEIPKLFQAASDNSWYNNIGIVLDANQIGAEKRYNKLFTLLQKEGGYDLPRSVPKEGLYVESHSKRKVEIWIMPDNKTDGYLEHFLEKLISKENLVKFVKAQKAVKQFNKSEAELIPEKAMQKAYIHTYLAWQQEPGKPISQAINANYFNPKLQAAKPFLKWLKLVFDFISQ